MANHPFEKFNLEPSLLDAVKDLNFTQPTEIQSRVIPKIMKQVNLIGQSQTGTGKSHAFLLPLMNSINTEYKEPQAIIVAPTRELAQQLFDVASHLAKFKNEVSVKLFIGGTDIEKDRNRAKNQPQLIIGTPTRINDLAKNGDLHVHLASYLVIDEADLIHAFVEDQDILNKPLHTVMGHPYPIVKAGSSIKAMLPLFTPENQAVLIDLGRDKFHIVTKHDLIAII